MAKLQDKFFNRVIEGDLEVTEEEAKKIAKKGVYLVSNVKALSNDVISQLKAGDIVVKQDASGNHPYIVSFRGEAGICLTYCDASCIETQSYDLVGGQWVYNSEDKTPNLLDVKTKTTYCHPLTISVVVGIDGKSYTAELCALIFNDSAEEINNAEKLISAINSFNVIGGNAKVLLVSGAIGSTAEGAFYMSARSLTKVSDYLYIEGIDNTGTRHTTSTNAIRVDNGTWSYVYDAVNPIN